MGQNLVGSHPVDFLHLARPSDLWLSRFIVPEKEDVYDGCPIRQRKGFAPNVFDLRRNRNTCFLKDLTPDC